MDCPAGYEPRNRSDGSLTCAPCSLGYLKRRKDGPTDACFRCKKNGWTIVTGATVFKRCFSKFCVMASLCMGGSRGGGGGVHGGLDHPEKSQ